MKKFTSVLSLVAILFAFSTAAQQTEAPKTGAKIYVESNTIQLSNGEATFDLYIVRSKKAGKTTFDVPQFVGSDKVNFEVQPDPANPDHFTVVAKGDDVQKLFYTVKSKSNSGTQMISGTTLTLVSGQNASVASNNE